MKSTAPWSVKGIERDAREAAKDAARREGLTVGEWLNRTIYTAGEDDIDSAAAGSRLKDLATALGHLSQRLAENEQKHDDVVSGLAKATSAAAERLERLENAAKGGVLAADPKTAQAQAQQTAAISRLEQAIGQVALQFNAAQKNTAARMGKSEQALVQLAHRVAAANEAASTASDGGSNAAQNGALAERLASADARLDALESQGETGDPAFVENTEKKLRVLGDEIKRSGDQIRALENSIQSLGQHIEAAERRSAVGVEKVGETIVALREELQAGRQAQDDSAANDVASELAALGEKTEARIGALQEAFQSVIDRLDRLSDGDETAAASVDAALADLNAEAPVARTNASTPSTSDPIKTFSSSEDAAPTAAPNTAERSTDMQEHNAGDEHAALLADVQAVFGLSDDAQDGAQNGAQDNAQDRAQSQTTSNEQQASADPTASQASNEATSFPAPAVTNAATTSADSAAGEDDDIDDIMAELDALGFGGDAASASDTPAAEPAQAQASDQTDMADDPLSAGFDDDISAAPTARDEDPLQSDPLDADTGAFSDDGFDEDANAATDIGLGAQSLGDAGLDLNITLPGAGADAQTTTSDLPAPNDGDATAGAADIVARAAASDGDNGQASASGGQSADDNQHAGDQQKARRRLSPRQRAILQEKIRRKRLAAARAARATENADLNSDADLGDLDTHGTSSADPLASDQGDERRSLLQTGRSLLGGGGRDKSAPSASSHNDDATNEDAADATAGVAGLANLNAITSRPLTAALGGAIVLSTAALVFSMRDYFFTNDPAAPVSASAAPAVDAPTEPASSAVTLDEQTTIENTPSLAPRDLFLTAMTALSTASTPETEATALEQLQQAAALGHPPAQLQLGEFYKLGQLVDADARQARTWYQRAANGGNVLAMHRLGVMAARGEGGAVDLETSITWFEKAANLGLVDSQYNLGATFHPTGDGSASGFQDRAKAYYWYSIAAANGDEQAAGLASGLAGGLGGGERTRLDQEIAAWSPLARDPEANERPGA
ncbi:MAG: hypothetical protein AAF224_07775 [Pseudomonadota bacterium]